MSRKLTSSVGVLLVSVLALGFIVPSVAGAEPLSCVGGQGAPTSSDTLSVAERQNIATYADQRKISYEVSEKDFLWKVELRATLESIENEFSSDFAGASMLPINSCQAWVGFRGPIPDNARKLLAQTSAPILVADNLGYTEAELTRKRDIISDLVEPQLGVAQSVASYDVVTGKVLVAVQSDRTMSEVNLERNLRLSLPETLRTDPAVNIEVGEQKRHVPADVYGGGILEYYGTEALACTAGFAVIRGTTRGLSTSGHCPNNPQFSNTPGAGEWLTVLQGEHQAQWGDFQWYTTNSYESDNFYYNEQNDGRDATAVRTVVRVGDRLCRFGRVTGDWCGNVIRINIDLGTLERVVQLDIDTDAGGDSGGPVFSGSEAAGLHYGCVFYTGEPCYDTFSPVVYMPEALPNVRVATT